MAGYLTLTAYENDEIIIYRTDQNGSPLLNPDDILIMSLAEIRGERIKKAKLRFNGDNYQIARQKVLNGALKEVVNKKIKDLEGII